MKLSLLPLQSRDYFLQLFIGLFPLVDSLSAFSLAFHQLPTPLFQRCICLGQVGIEIGSFCFPPVRLLLQLFPFCRLLFCPSLKCGYLSPFLLAVMLHTLNRGALILDERIFLLIVASSML